MASPFVQTVARRTGLDPRVVSAWVRAEGGPMDNPLNIGPGRHYGSWQGAANATAQLLLGSHYYRGIIGARGNPSAQLAAIKASPWDAGHYSNGGLDRVASELGLRPGVRGMALAPLGGRAAAPRSNLDSLLPMFLQNEAMIGIPAPPLSSLTGGQPGARGASSLAPLGRLGRISFAPGADRAGVHTQPGVIAFARRVAGVLGVPLTIGTGTQHNQFVAGTHRVSDHWSGRAVDIPARGNALTRLGQAALIAAGADPRWARRQRGGLFNIGGHQIIFNSMTGGNHYNHLHISG